jgi:hypothetical protein
MRAPPPETLYLPFDDAPYRMALGLTTAAAADWFEIDTLYHAELAQRRHLLTHQRPDVFAAQPASHAARREALTMIVENLTTHHSDWFSRDGATLINHLTGEHWRLDPPEDDPLVIAGLLVQEDLCVIQLDGETPIFTAATLCFPSRWRLTEKIGKPLGAVHRPVPLYADRLERPVDRFMRHVREGHIATRLNWSVLDDSALFQPAGKWRVDVNATVTAANAGESLYLRVERQTLRRLPDSTAVLFGIRVHVYRLDTAITSTVHARRLAGAIRALPDEIARYKSLGTIREAALAWLDAYR